MSFWLVIPWRVALQQNSPPLHQRRRSSAECFRLGLADEIRYSILPILIGDGIPFFEKLDRDVALHLADVKAYKSGMVELHYEVRGHRGESRNAT